MADTDFPIILLPFSPDCNDYTSRASRGPRNRVPSRDRQTHGQRIQRRFVEIFQNTPDVQVAAIRERGGMYVQFRGLPDHDLATKSLENLSKGIRLLNINQTKVDGEITTSATVFVPSGKENHFIRKVEKYLEGNPSEGGANPPNAPLVDTIEDVAFAVIEAMWTDKPEAFPRQDKIWCELWLRSGEIVAETLGGIRETCDNLEIRMGDGYIDFPERVVVPVLANRNDLQRLLDSSGLIAEVRRLAETAHYWLELDNKDQAEGVDDLLTKIDLDEESKVRVLILDTGINRGHSLLENMIEEDKLFTINDDWGVHDHDGHGTLMAGTVAYGDILELLNGNYTIAIGLKIESGKILPPIGENSRKLYGYYTGQLISQAELADPEARRIITMAVAEDIEYDGRPSSWSGAIDALTSGASDETKRLVILSAGNVEPNNDEYTYIDSNGAARIESPGQSWNALTVGGMTRKAILRNQSLDDYAPVAPSGGLSPFSKTSILWEDKWPIKPEVVFEAGNIAKHRDEQFFTEADDLSLVSTNYNPTVAQFRLFNMTSASTALASHMAAKIAHEYTAFWPETIRGLMVHSAQWTDAMREQFLGDDPKKGDYYRLLRYCGYGEPVLQRAISCASNSMTMVMQQTLQPFEKAGAEGNYRCRTKDMHFHELAFPEEVFLGLGNVPVRLRITLSYFIEPGPGEIGWKDRYRYPSHGLRFDVNNPTETFQQFSQRINSQAQETEPKFTNDSSRWMLGRKRDKGSIHSDIIETTAAQIATCKHLAVYPTVGWWRERKHLGKFDKECRYSLIVSLETPDETIDVYNTISTEIENRVSVEVEGATVEIEV